MKKPKPKSKSKSTGQVMAWEALDLFAAAQAIKPGDLVVVDSMDGEPAGVVESGPEVNDAVVVRLLDGREVAVSLWDLTPRSIVDEVGRGGP